MRRTLFHRNSEGFFSDVRRLIDTLIRCATNQDGAKQR